MEKVLIFFLKIFKYILEKNAKYNLLIAIYYWIFILVYYHYLKKEILFQSLYKVTFSILTFIILSINIITIIIFIIQYFKNKINKKKNKQDGKISSS